MIDKKKIENYYNIRENNPERTRTLRGNFYFSNFKDDDKSIANDSIFMESYKLFVKDIQPIYKAKEYKTQILLVGYSIEPIILSILGLAARRIIFIYSEDTRSECSRIRHFIEVFEKNFKLEPKYAFVTTDNRNNSDNKFCVDSSLPQSTFHAINEAITMEIEENRVPREKICINVTGGKKSMGNGAYIAANILNIDTYYVDFKGYDHDRPTFGTERLIALPFVKKIKETLETKESAISPDEITLPYTKRFDI